MRLPDFSVGHRGPTLPRLCGPWALPCLLLASVCAAEPAATTVDPAALTALLSRLEKLEERVRQQDEEIAQLRRLTSTPGSIASSSTPRPSTSTAANAPVGQRRSSAASDVISSADDWQEPTAPTLTLRGFGDVNYRWDRGRARHNSFSLGQLDLLITSRITEDVHLLDETVFEMDQNGETDIDVERLLIKYSASDYLNISAGRYHTAIGYYNTAYHHGTWFQTATGRPLPFRSEDAGGVLPMHNVGLSINGDIPSGSLGLRYTLELGNGRDYLRGGVQHATDVNRDKAVNLAVIARPEAVPGLQAGASFYVDRIKGANTHFDQSLLALHVVYQTAEFEWLNEYYTLAHEQDSPGSRYRTTGFYSQISRAFGAYRPYFRFQYLKSPLNDPLLASIHRGETYGPTFGLRYELASFTAIKLQYDRLEWEGDLVTDDFTVQWTFTF
jgi:hypothetical protein